MSQSSGRQTLLLDAAWQFHLGDIPSPMPNTHIAAYMANKAGWSRGTAKRDYDDSDWRTVDLPHDWSIEGAFDLANHVDAASLPRGDGWYRRYFRLEDSDRGRYLALQFDGVATHCTVYVNGHLLHRNFCGYTPFTIDISDIATFGDELNAIAVHVDATYMEGWWYEGSGIYRHVWLTRAGGLHVAPQGVFVRPERISSDEWIVHLEMTIQNTSDQPMSGRVISDLHSPSGAHVGRAETTITVAPFSAEQVQQTVRLQRPVLWTLQAPQLHGLTTRVISSTGEALDELRTPFGCRTIRFDADEGFFLNDEHVLLKGTCNHQDHAGVGVALPDSIHEFRIRRLLDMGSNAYRCAHNPPAPELLDACDRLGMLVIDENRNFGSSPEHLGQLRAMVLRDRNHPSVICWSICNEEAIQGTPVAHNIAQSMAHEVRRLDPSRPAAAVVSGGILNDNCLADADLDVVGINYQLHLHEPFHTKHPRTPLVAAETHCLLATRGEYRTDPSRHVFGAYDVDIARWGATGRATWQAVASRLYVAGLFIWTGFDYRGEPSPHAWPCVSSFHGLLDTCGFEKDSFFLHKAYFTREPFIHLMPHWTWPGQEGRAIRVVAYTNCEAVELFLNGETLGRAAVDPIEMADWSVLYKAGTLRAVGYRGDVEVATSEIQTAGPAVALGLEVHRSTPGLEAAGFPADGRFALPVTIFAVDSAGRRVPTAADGVAVLLTGPAKLLGVGNGDPTSHEPDTASSRRLFNGLAQAVIQTTTAAGTIALHAQSGNLQPATLKIETKPAAPLPAMPAVQPRHFITGWRMSAIAQSTPDINQAISDTDMNSWERIEPAPAGQSAWTQAMGYAVYRATITPPKQLQRDGGVVLFAGVIGLIGIAIDGVSVPCLPDPVSHLIQVPIRPGLAKTTVSVLVRAEAAGAGLTQPVELLATTSGVAGDIVAANNRTRGETHR